MYATATTHLPHPCEVVADHTLGGRADHARWLPELRRTDGRPLDEPGARSSLTIDLGRGPEVVALTTRAVVRTTVTASGRTSAGEAVDLTLSLSPWHGGTAVVLTVDVDGPGRPLLSWSLTRRLETALVRLAGEVAVARSTVRPTRP